MNLLGKLIVALRWSRVAAAVITKGTTTVGRLAAVTLLLVACGESATREPAATTAAAAPTPAGASQVTATSTTSGGAATSVPGKSDNGQGAVGTRGTGSSQPSTLSLLQRNDPPPNGVRAQLAFNGAGGVTPCVTLGYRFAFTLQSSDLVDLPDPEQVAANMPWAFPLCLDGYVPCKEIHVSVTLPSGQVRRDSFLADANGRAWWNWKLLETDPSGRYQLLVSQGEGPNQQTSRLGVTVSRVPANSLSLGVWVAPMTGRPATELQVGLAGYKPYQKVVLYLYRRHAGARAFRYAAKVATLRTDGSGAATYTLVTRRGDPPGDYRIWTPADSKYPKIGYFVLAAARSGGFTQGQPCPATTPATTVATPTYGIQTPNAASTAPVVPTPPAGGEPGYTATPPPVAATTSAGDSD